MTIDSMEEENHVQQTQLDNWVRFLFMQVFYIGSQYV